MWECQSTTGVISGHDDASPIIATAADHASSFLVTKRRCYQIVAFITEELRLQEVIRETSNFRTERARQQAKKQVDFRMGAEGPLIVN